MAEGLKLEQVQAAMKAMMAKALERPEEPIAMCIVDATGNLEAYAKMDNLRMFSITLLMLSFAPLSLAVAGSLLRLEKGPLAGQDVQEA